MPVYSFKCESCGDDFEDFRSIADKKESGSCIACGSSQIKRLDSIESSCGCGCGCGDPSLVLGGAQHGHGGEGDCC